MAHYVYRLDDGTLVSWGAEDVDPADPRQVTPEAELQERGLVFVQGLPPLSSTHAWDALTRTVAVVQGEAAAVFIETGDWVMRLTTAEFTAITTSENPLVRQFVFAFNRKTTVNLSSATFRNGVGYLAQQGLIGEERLPALLAA